MPELAERPAAFNHGYCMNCECGGTSNFSAQEYHAKATQGALMLCEHCECTIHFGPAVVALRDPDDPALDNAQIDQLAWYHTSTAADWPLNSYAAENRALLKKSARRFHLPESSFEHLLTQALHVGTYEAAIENMLRGMGASV